MTENQLGRVLDAGFDRLESLDNDVSRIEQPLRTVLVVYSAQGVIDNGGLAYFFERDWPHHPPYDVFVSAYEAIGLVKEAAAKRRSNELI